MSKRPSSRRKDILSIPFPPPIERPEGWGGELADDPICSTQQEVEVPRSLVWKGEDLGPMGRSVSELNYARILALNQYTTTRSKNSSLPPADLCCSKPQEELGQEFLFPRDPVSKQPPHKQQHQQQQQQQQQKSKQRRKDVDKENRLPCNKFGDEPDTNPGEKDLAAPLAESGAKRRQKETRGASNTGGQKEGCRKQPDVFSQLVAAAAKRNNDEEEKSKNTSAKNSKSEPAAAAAASGLGGQQACCTAAAVAATPAPAAASESHTSAAWWKPAPPPLQLSTSSSASSKSAATDISSSSTATMATAEGSIGSSSSRASTLSPGSRSSTSSTRSCNSSGGGGGGGGGRRSLAGRGGKGGGRGGARGGSAAAAFHGLGSRLTLSGAGAGGGGAGGCGVGGTSPFSFSRSDSSSLEEDDLESLDEPLSEEKPCKLEETKDGCPCKNTKKQEHTGNKKGKEGGVFKGDLQQDSCCDEIGPKRPNEVSWFGVSAKRRCSRGRVGGEGGEGGDKREGGVGVEGGERGEGGPAPALAADRDEAEAAATGEFDSFRTLSECPSGAEVNIEALVTEVGPLRKRELPLQPGEFMTTRELTLSAGSKTCTWTLWSAHAAQYGEHLQGCSIRVRGAKVHKFRDECRLTGCHSVEVLQKQ